MLKDRRVLMEQELVKQKQACGQIYKNIVTGQSSGVEQSMYDSMKLKLADMIADLAIVDQLIADGAE